MSNIVSIDPEHRLIGTWKCCDGFSDVTFRISMVDGALHVQAFDPESDTAPEVHGTCHRPFERTLDFSVHWTSTGRFTRYSVVPSPVTGRIAVTFTYTAMEFWEQAT